MKNTKLTKHLKRNIAKSMYDTYRCKDLTYWNEFISEIKFYHPFVTETLHWENWQIESNIIDKNWFRSYIHRQTFY